MAMDGIDDLYKLHRFQPSDVEAVTHFLPHLLAGTPLPHGADMLIRHAEVYVREPKDLAAEYAPVPTAVKTGDRFFFTTCKGTNGRFKRSAGTGTWTINKTENIYHADVKVGEVRKLSFRKDKMSTGWVMEEYRCLLPEAVVADGEKVFCKIHLALSAPAAARQESAAYKLRQQPAEPAHAPEPEPVTVTESAHGQKRPAPVTAADQTSCKKMRMAAADQTSCKKMRMAAPVPVAVPEPEEDEYEDCPMWSTPAVPVPLPAASTEDPAAAEAEDDMGRLSCSWEEIFGEQQEEEQTLPLEAENSMEWDDEELQSLLADDDDKEARLYKGCYYNAAAADLHASSSLDGRSHFFSFAACN